MQVEHRPPAFDAIAAVYDETRGGEPRGERFAAVLAEYLPAGANLLEVGVGTGLVGLAMTKRGYQVTGIDASPEMLKRAKPRIAESLVADVEDLPFADSRFAGAYAVWVMHMPGNIGRALREVRRVLGQGAKFLTASVGNAPSQDPIGCLVGGMQLKLLGPRFSPDSPDEISRRAIDADFAFEGTASVRQTLLSAPSRVADNLASRGYSNLQSVGNEEWERVVEPTIAALRALPDPDQQIPRHVEHVFSILRAV